MNAAFGGGVSAAFGGGVGAALEASEAAPSTEGQRDEEEGHGVRSGQHEGGRREPEAELPVMR